VGCQHFGSKNGYIKDASLQKVIDETLPDLEKEIDKYIDTEHNKHAPTLAALMRDYMFLASGYSLETAHLPETRDGKARDHIPPQLALPLKKLGTANECFPWMDYAHGYGLNNAQLRTTDSDPKKWDSYDTIRMFNGNPSESGFINVHVAMVAQSGQLLKYQQVWFCSLLFCSSARGTIAQVPAELVL
jgi:hypothetical protein